MRFNRIAVLPLLAALAFVPGRSNAQVSADIHIGQAPRSWGHEIVINPYAESTFGDWHRAYRRWTPVTLYFHDGRYFDRRVRGSRPVVVYRYHNQYFYPPQDKEWMHKDRRYNYRYAPHDDDYNRPRPQPGPPHQ